MLNDTPFARGAVAANIILPLVATVAVALRFLTRWSKGDKLKSDDWTILAALIPSVAMCASGLYTAYAGLLGGQLRDIGYGGYVTYKKVIFSDLILGHFTYGLAKISVVLFYKRIFQIPKFILLSNFMLLVIALWMISAFFSVLFCAKGISAFWTTVPEREGTQFNIHFASLITAMSIIDIALDLVILLLPLPVIEMLKLSRKRKLYLSGVFLLGAFCLVSSGVRLHWSRLVFDYTTSNRITRFEITDHNLLWAHIEACMSVLTACLPTIYTLIRRPGQLKQGFARMGLCVGARRRDSDDLETSPHGGPKFGLKMTPTDSTERLVEEEAARGRSGWFFSAWRGKKSESRGPRLRF